jgi:DNA-binding PadR family transcriptional regulator
MAYTDILILRHLSRRSAHGYELRKRIEQTTGIVVNNNSLYPALRRFVEAGAVRMTVEQQDSRPPRHIYEMTDVGTEVLHDLIAEITPAQAGDDLEFLTRLGQFEYLEPHERADILDARTAALTTRAAGLGALSGRTAGEFWSAAVIDHLRESAEAELRWLQTLSEKVAEP